MKKLLLFTLTFCLFKIGIAQIGETLEVGFRLSPIFSYASITDDNGSGISGLSTNGAVGIAYGPIINYKQTDNYGLQSGVIIARKTFERSQNVNGTAATQKVTITSVEVPITLRGKSNEVGQGYYISGVFGISVDVRAAYKNSYKGLNPVNGTPGDNVIKNSSLVNPLGFTFVFGPTVEKDSRAGTLQFGVSFHQGLTNVNNQSEFGNNEKIKTRYVALNFGYMFN